MLKLIIWKKWETFCWILIGSYFYYLFSASPRILKADKKKFHSLPSSRPIISNLQFCSNFSAHKSKKRNANFHQIAIANFSSFFHASTFFVLSQESLFASFLSVPHMKFIQKVLIKSQKSRQKIIFSLLFRLSHDNLKFFATNERKKSSWNFVSSQNNSPFVILKCFHSFPSLSLSEGFLSSQKWKGGVHCDLLF